MLTVKNRAVIPFGSAVGAHLSINAFQPPLMPSLLQESIRLLVFNIGFLTAVSERLQEVVSEYELVLGSVRHLRLENFKSQQAYARSSGWKRSHPWNRYSVHHMLVPEVNVLEKLSFLGNTSLVYSRSSIAWPDLTDNRL